MLFNKIDKKRIHYLSLNKTCLRVELKGINFLRKNAMGNRKIALITGINGQDGSYLSELLLKKNYIVHGILRRSSYNNTQRIDHLINKEKDFIIHYGDLTDSSNIIKIIKETSPDEIYNIGAQSHVGVSFDSPEYTHKQMH